THDLDTLYAICDRVAVLADRRILEVAPIAELQRRQHPWVQDGFHGPRRPGAQATARRGRDRMETKANYVLIGAFTLAAAAFLLLFGLWAAKFSSDRGWQAYLVVFTEPVTGLTEGSSVQYNGIAVGTVETLNLDAKDPRRVIARLKVEADVPVKVDTRAKMSITGLTGVPFIQLTGGSPNAAPLVPKDRDDI